MKGMPLPYDFEGKGVLDLELLVNSRWNNNSSSNNDNNIKESCFLVNNQKFNSFQGGSGDCEPTSVLDTVRSHSPPTSSSTLSSSLAHTVGVGGGGGCSSDTAVVAEVSGNYAPSTTTSLDVVPQIVDTEAGGGIGDKCGGLEEWESILPESFEASPGQDQSILRWIMGDVDDPSMANLNKVLQIGGGAPPSNFESGGGFGGLDHALGGDSLAQVTNFIPNLNSSVSVSSSNISGWHDNNGKTGSLTSFCGDFADTKIHNFQNQMFPCNVGGFEFNQAPQQVMQHGISFVSEEMKPPIFNPQVFVNEHQAQHSQNPSFFMPLPCGQQAQNLLMPPQGKRHNPGTLGGLEQGGRAPKRPFSYNGQEFFMGKPPLQQQQQQQMLQGLPNQLQFLPHYLQQRPATGSKQKLVEEDTGHQQQPIIDQLYKAAELVQTGNALLAQSILARLNHQLSPIGKPFYRAAFYCKEALQLLLQSTNFNPCLANTSRLNVLLKIGAYKSFSEISPVIQFANFTCNQALLEVLEGFDRIHIIDFEIGYGGQWASLMQELALRSGGSPSVKITTFASPSSHDQFELSLAQDSLMYFANEINVAFEFEILSTESLNSAPWSLPFHVSENEAIVVNLPVSSFASNQLSLPLVLRFIKQLSPKIVVSVDRGCDRTDLPFPSHVIHALQSHSNLLESVDAANVNLDSLQKIERLLIQPGIERIIFNRYHSPDKTHPWRNLFLSSGLSPLTFSNFTESQADCLVKRTPVRGFHVEKRQSSLVLCWQRKELISASAWRC